MNAEEASNISMKQRKILRRVVKSLLVALFLLPAIFFLAVIGVQIGIKHAAQGRGFWHVHEIQGTHVGLVFGCDDRFHDRENLYFKYRMETTAKLWHAGKLRCIIVSGDNRALDYNEPQKMHNALVKLGVPSDRIAFDFAGLRTLDSVVRCKKVFNTNQVLMISQQFQNERALFIARAHGMNAIAFHAPDVGGRGGKRTKIREWGARVKMWLDLYILDTQPKHLGPTVPLPE